jgi:hypothetical protein
MTILASLGKAELIIIAVALIPILALGNYGRGTALGYWGSVLLSIFSTPLIAFIIILYLKTRKPA